MEISSDGGPEFTASVTADFLSRWGVHHRISSAYFPQSNGRAEVAVKKCKRLLMDNIGPTGSLNSDNLLQALLQVLNTPDPDCNISPAEIMFGRQIRDGFSFVSRQAKFSNPSIRPIWREAWAQKEDAMRVRFSRSEEALNSHARQLPPLSLGDRVFLQNQSGPHPTKWDKSGIIVDTGQHNQYLVKVDGSGRLTKRNRRFLRKFISTSLSINPSIHKSVVSAPRPHIIAEPVQAAETHDHTPPSYSTAAVPVTTNIPIVEAEHEMVEPPVVTPATERGEEPQQGVPELSSEVPTTTITPPTLPAPPTPTAVQTRPQRQACPRKFYVPETGQWKTR